MIDLPLPLGIWLEMEKSALLKVKPGGFVKTQRTGYYPRV